MRLRFADWAGGLTALALLSVSCAGYAQDTPHASASSPATSSLPTAHHSAPEPLDSVKQTPLFDSDKRRTLADRGITFSSRFIEQAAVNREGYAGDGWKHIQDINLGLALDLGKLGVADNGTVRLVLSDRTGHSLQEYTGGYFQNQSNFGQGQNFRFDELSYERTFLKNRLSVKGGFYSMGNDFALLPYLCNLTTNGFCGHPLALAQGSGWQNSPTGQWGLRAKWSDPAGWYVAAGAYDVTPLRKEHDYGFDLGFPGETTGYIFPFEVGYSHGKTPADYAGTYRVGGYYDTSKGPRQGRPGEQVEGRYGGHAQVAQQVWKPQPDTVRGIAVFGVANLADSRTGLFREYYEVGASWRGIVAARKDDIASLGLAQAHLNPRLREQQEALGQPIQTSEKIWELNYTIQATRWLIVRPTFQYVIRPHGLDERPDTAVFVLHLQATL